MKLTVLGAGTCIPMAGYSPSGHLVEFDDKVVLMDIGPGTLSRMANQGVNYQDLDYILLTHLHPDHTLDLLTFFQASNSAPGWKRTEPLTIVSGYGSENFLHQLFCIFEGTEPESFDLAIYELGRDNLSFEGWSLSTELTGHTENSLAFRISEGDKSIVYSGDAAQTEGLLRLAQDGDVLLCECSLPSEMATPDHLTPEQVGQLARDARVSRVVLTHLYPQTLKVDVVAQIQACYPGPVDLAHDGWSLII
jgi:ribonuclease Z